MERCWCGPAGATSRTAVRDARPIGTPRNGAKMAGSGERRRGEGTAPVRTRRRRGFASRPLIGAGGSSGVVCWRRGARRAGSILDYAQSVRLIFVLPAGAQNLSVADFELARAVLQRREPVGLLFSDLVDAQAFRHALGYRPQPPIRLVSRG